MRILIGGDILPTESNMALFEKGDAEQLFGVELIGLFQSSQFRVANLEGAFTDSINQILKTGPAIKASLESINGMLPLQFNVLSLANNHNYDFGEYGLKQTIDLLKSKGINFVGGGISASDAKKPYIGTFAGITVGVYSCAETEFTVAADTHGGANPFDPLEICDDIANLKEQVDYLIVLYHGMKEGYKYPAPYVQKRCRKMIDKGADIVLCQHSHCIGCMESYNNGTILYGQGDFMFCRSENELRNSGLLVSVELPERKIEFIPIVRKDNKIRLAKAEEKEKILFDFYFRSDKIKDQKFLKEEYADFSSGLLREYDTNSLGIFGNIITRLHLGGMIHRMFRKNNDLFQLNALQCEAHRDVYINGLKRRVYGLNSASSEGRKI